MVVIFGAVVPLPFLALAFTADSTTLLYPMLFAAQVTASVALGAAAATTQDLVLPGCAHRDRDLLHRHDAAGAGAGALSGGAGVDLSGSLSVGMLSLLASAPITLAAAIAAFRLVPAAERTREDRARAAGELL